MTEYLTNISPVNNFPHATPMQCPVHTDEMVFMFQKWPIFGWGFWIQVIHCQVRLTQMWKKLIHEVRWCMTHSAGNILGLSHTICWHIFTTDVNMKWIIAKSVPHLLNDDQNTCNSVQGPARWCHPQQKLPFWGHNRKWKLCLCLCIRNKAALFMFIYQEQSSSHPTGRGHHLHAQKQQGCAGQTSKACCFLWQWGNAS